MAVIAKLRWYSEVEGGRAILPSDFVYGANLRFAHDKTLWSVVLLLPFQLPDSRGYQEVPINFLRQDMREKLLEIGQRFYLTEGPERIVAEGEIISLEGRSNLLP